MNKNINQILINNNIPHEFWENTVEFIKTGSFVRFHKQFSNLDLNESKKLYLKLKKELNLKEHYVYAKDSLGIPRYKMPQIRSENRKEFFQYLTSNGYKIKNSNLSLKDLKCSQRELNTFNIEKKITKIKCGELKPLIVSKDNYILDGHHNFVAASLISPKNKYPCFQISLNIHELIKIACSFHKVEFEEFQ
jgi:hypothetical protein